MNPYKTFEKLGKLNDLDATLVKKDGTTLALRVKPETRGSETLEGEYSNALGVREWSANVSDFTDSETGAILAPEQGDALLVVLDDGTTRGYSITRSTITARYWDWFYPRPGYRVRFYTKYEGAEP